MINLKELFLSGANILPLVEGGKGIGASDGKSAGSWAKCGGLGTFSGVSPVTYDDNGDVVPIKYKARTRAERHEEYVQFSIQGSLSQARIARDVSGAKGRINMNVLWEMGGVEKILHGVLEKSQGLIHGITCGAGMPYRLADIASKYKVYYHPIVSSARAFHALWRRSFCKAREWLGSVVYEDPWRAGGHNGISRAEDPTQPESPMPRVMQLRQLMNKAGLLHVPIIMAGGVWCLSEWTDWINNKDLGPVAFQFGTRPLLTQESPVSAQWKHRLLHVKKGDVVLNKFSPTGFYSSAVNNSFLRELQERVVRQVPFAREQTEEFCCMIPVGPRGRPFYLRAEDEGKVAQWVASGFCEPMVTPDNTLVFVGQQKKNEIVEDQRACMGCLSGCMFSNWSQAHGTTGRLPDPRSYCIQKTLLNIIGGGDTDKELMFGGSNAYRFSEDPFYKGGRIPTVKELFDRILSGA